MATVRREFRNIALIRLSAIGDVVMALPALEALRQAHPLARISWIVERRAANILEGHPALDEVIEFPRFKAIARGSPLRWVRIALAFLGFRRQLRRRRFDLSIDFQGNLKSGLCTWAAGAPVRIGYARSFCREPNWLFTNRRVDFGGACLNRMQGELILAATAGASPLFRKPRIAFTAEEMETAESIAAEARPHTPPLVAIHPGTSDFMPHKRWPPESYRALGSLLAKRCGARILLSYGPGEEDMIADLERGLREDGVRADRLPAGLSMKALGCVLGRMDLVVGGDTGPVHLAVATGAPVLILLGPSDPRIYHPIGHPERAVYRRAACSPCRNRSCTDLQCMRSLLPEEVADRAERILRARAGGLP